LPELLHETLQRAHDGELELTWKSTELAQLREQLRASERRYYFAISGGALLVTAALLGDWSGIGAGLVSVSGAAALSAAVVGV
jgi:ubiquinone biosynthesis protein